MVQIPLRSVLHENTYSHLDYQDITAYDDLFACSKGWLSRYLDIVLKWNESAGLLTFATNFLVPQQSPIGRLQPRNDIRSMVHFIERLNAFLYEEISRRKNVYLLDIDQLAASVGKRYIQDDSVLTLSHGSILSDAENTLDQARIQPPRRMSEHYTGLIEGRRTFFEMGWAELAAMYRTIRQIDSVKLVIFDLDDTLWRGVIAEDGQVTSDNIEGWPVGLMEAICFLKKRGMLVAITSKNNEDRITALWDRIVGGRLRLKDFASRKINWLPKSDNIMQIIKEVNVTPRSVVFVDDNPVEREVVKAAFPDIRVLGSHPYYLRRVLLWAPETQVSVITDESARRTEMVQAQIEREDARSNMSRDAFLQTLFVRIRFVDIRSTDHTAFARALELINKTNQYNTTGRHLSGPQCVNLFARGAVFHAFELRDKFSHYGLVGVAIVLGGHISQFVMSCRVLGLEAENALLTHIGGLASGAGAREISADFVETELNALSGDLYKRNGFIITEEGKWVLPLKDLPGVSPHIEIVSSWQ